MKFGSFKSKLVVLKQSQTKNEYGEYVVSYAEYKTIWGARQELTHTDILNKNSKATLKFITRYMSTLLVSDRIKYLGVDYLVKSITPNIDNYYQTIILEVIEN